MQVPEQGVAYGFGLRADDPKPEGFRARSPNPGLELGLVPVIFLGPFICACNAW